MVSKAIGIKEAVYTWIMDGCQDFFLIFAQEYTAHRNTRHGKKGLQRFHKNWQSVWFSDFIIAYPDLIPAQVHRAYPRCC